MTADTKVVNSSEGLHNDSHHPDVQHLLDAHQVAVQANTETSSHGYGRGERGRRTAVNTSSRGKLSPKR